MPIYRKKEYVEAHQLNRHQKHDWIKWLEAEGFFRAWENSGAKLAQEGDYIVRKLQFGKSSSRWKVVTKESFENLYTLCDNTGLERP